MPQKSPIEWTDLTTNPYRARRKDNGKVGWHCNLKSRGCAHCYSEVLNIRFGTGLPFNAASNGLVDLFLNGKELAALLKTKGPARVFPCDMTDLFLEQHSFGLIAAFWAVMAACPDLTFQVLTKRPERALEWFAWIDGMSQAVGSPHDLLGLLLRRFDESLYGLASRGGNPLGLRWPLPNVHFGVSVENRRQGVPRIELLRKIPAALLWLSVEPLVEDLGDIDLSGIGWVVCGGESGAGADPMHPRWARRVRDRCVAAGVPFFFKQWGGWEPMVHAQVYALYMATEAPPKDLRQMSKGVVILHPDGRRETPRPSREWWTLAAEMLTPAIDEDDRDPFDGPVAMHRVGKKVAGRALDGRAWDQLPERQAVPA